MVSEVYVNLGVVCRVEKWPMAYVVLLAILVVN